MKHFWGCLIFVLLVANVAAQGRAAETAAVREAFSQYRLALLKGDGARAAELVDARTLARYGEWTAKALDTPRENLTRLDFVSKMMVLRIRHEFSKAQIEKMSGRDLFISGVERGWIAKSDVESIKQLASVKVERNSASASIPLAPNVHIFHFEKESGQWKLSLWLLLEMSNDAMKPLVAKSGLTEEQFIINILNMLSAKEVDERILSGPLE